MQVIASLPACLSQITNKKKERKQVIESWSLDHLILTVGKLTKKKKKKAYSAAKKTFKHFSQRSSLQKI